MVRIIVTIVAYFFIIFSAQADVPISVFGTLPEIDDAAVSPDGQTVALLENLGDDSIVRFFDIKTGNQSEGVRVGNLKARDLIWASNDRVLLLVSFTNTLDTVAGRKTYEFWRYASVSKSGKKTVYLLNKGETNLYTGAGQLLHMLPDDQDHILMAKRDPNFSKQPAPGSRIRGGASGFEVDTSSLNVFKVNLNNGGARVKLSGTNDTVDWIIDEAGEPFLRIDLDEPTNIKTIKRRKTRTKFEDVMSINTVTSPNMSFYSMEGPVTAIVTTHRGKDKLGAYILSF